MDKHCYINSLAQVSCQSPLSDQWFESPIEVEGDYIRSQEADIKGLISPGEARRMSKILKRAVATSLAALREADINMPEAIVTGTGKGCIENSEKFLIDLYQYGESCLKPTLFMQSTHNTISSLIAILLKCHGYNNTYSQQGISFESALFDAWLQMKLGAIANALVGSHDEVTPFIAKVLRRVQADYTTITETSMSTVLSNEISATTLCEVTEVKLTGQHDIAQLINEKSDPIVLLGVNGNSINDQPYEQLLQTLEYQPLLLRYKNIFGNNFSVSAMSLYVGATILAKQTIPQSLLYRGCYDGGDINSITIINHSDNATWSLIRLKRI